MKTAFVTRRHHRWVIILISPMNFASGGVTHNVGDKIWTFRPIIKTDGFQNVHAWARNIAKERYADIIVWDSRVILSQHYRGRSDKAKYARMREK